MKVLPSASILWGFATFQGKQNLKIKDLFSLTLQKVRENITFFLLYSQALRSLPKVP